MGNYYILTYLILILRQLDILVSTKVDNKYAIRGFYNNYIYDAFFLKSFHLLLENKWSSSNIGSSYRYIATNLDGSRRMDTSYQLSQLSGVSLNLPYAFLGIGRSNNYIENFHVISSTKSTVNFFIIQISKNYNIFTPIIPNSQLIISENMKTDGHL